ncbi:MAG: 30S ribosomal protein S24e [Candidatus Marsarchaeota archaeon]|jgi:ribosomal protein S24E|nr:30S ribosomal protein S24e [Candidatus Marsarchaeota archaeon]
MEIKISSDKENKLFKRREISFLVLGEEKTPSAMDVKRELCKKLNISPDATLVKELYQAFGERLCNGTAVSYENAESMAKNEQKHKIARRSKAEAKAQKPAEEEKKE